MVETIEIFDLIFQGMNSGFGYWWIGGIGMLIVLFVLISQLSGQGFFATSLLTLALVFPAVIIGIVDSPTLAAVSILIFGTMFGWFFWKLLSS